MLVVGTGGLSHQLDGKRAGFINKEFDLLCLDKLVDDPEALTRYSIPQLVEQAGAQGVEFLNWMAMRGALTGQVTQGAPQLSHPDFQHRGGDDGSGERRHRGASRRSGSDLSAVYSASLVVSREGVDVLFARNDNEHYFPRHVDLCLREPGRPGFRGSIPSVWEVVFPHAMRATSSELTLRPRGASTPCLGTRPGRARRVADQAGEKLRQACGRHFGLTPMRLR